MKYRFLFLSLIVLFNIQLVTKAQQRVEPMAEGIYKPTWESLRQYDEAPEWFQNAKFGMWSHWGPQCQPEYGDWYARMMYYSGSWQYNYHVSKYGSPAVFGFKDVINSWKAPKWNPDSLVHLYKQAGAQYFFAMANHHDNFDMFDSKYQPWNSIVIGPKKDIVGGWAQAAKKYGLPFGVSVHASRAWTWLEASQDWDGNLTAADGKGKWWDGLDPQDLYAQRHPRSTNSTDPNMIVSQWEWGNGASLPDTAYINKYYNRTIDLINKYDPELIYFDDTSLPMTPISDVGLRIAAHLYNKSMQENNGNNRAVIFGKKLTTAEKDALVWDVERGVPDRPQSKYWQTCTCIGDWHYNINTYNNNSYKQAHTVVRMLVDVVSKNGNMLLNIPVRGDGSIDDKAYKIVKDLTAWMNVNKGSIYSTRPWITFGEGPTAEAVIPLSGVGFNEGVNYSAKDIRYVCKKDTVFATVMGWPSTSKVTFKALGTASTQYLGKINQINLLGYGTLPFVRDMNGLTVTFPSIPTATGLLASVIRVQFEPVLYSFANLTELIQQCEQAVGIAKTNSGFNTGQVNPDSIARFESVITKAKSVSASVSDEQIRVEIITLQTAFNHFFTEGTNKAGKISFNSTQNITREVLGESRNFARSDEGITGTGRFGLLADPWIVSKNIINQENFTRGGFDDYESSRSISIQKWFSTDPAITNGMIYQVVKLPAGSYKLRIKVHEKSRLLAGENYLCVVKNSVLPATADVPGKSLAYYDMSKTFSGGQYTVCPFVLDTAAELSIGWSTTLAASSIYRSMRVNEILLLDENNNDISATYLKNYKNIQRKDRSFTRYGTPARWTVENYSFNMPDNEGVKNGIDTYTGYKSLMFGVWNDFQYTTSNLSDVKMYKKITLPAGIYAFTAGYDAVDRLTNMNLFVSRTIPTSANVQNTSIVSYSMTNSANDGTHYGLQFELPKTESVYLGWVGSLKDATYQEFRAKEVSLLRVLSKEADFLTDMTFDVSKPGEYLMDMSQFDNLNALKWGLSPDNVNYVVGANTGKVELGYINFGTGLTQQLQLSTASNSVSNDNQTYQVFKDDESTPFLTIKAKYTGGPLRFETVKSSAIQIDGIHKITVKYVNHNSNLQSVGFTVNLVSSVKPVNEKKNVHSVCSIEGGVMVKNAQGSEIAVFDLTGQMKSNLLAQSQQQMIKLPRGIYLIQIDSETEKVAVR